MGSTYLLFGVEIIKRLVSGEDINTPTKIFPHVTLCDFETRQMSNFQPHTVECALPINLFNEKIFILIWFWLVMLTWVNMFSLLFWISSLFLITRKSYMKKYLGISERMRRSKLDKQHLRCFVEYYLRQDGVFAIKMLSRNTNDVIVSEIVTKLWDHFILHHQNRREFHCEHPINIESELVAPKQRPDYLPNNGIQQDNRHTSPTTPGNIFP